MYGETRNFMRHLTIKCVDTFTTKPFCGNPAGVITEAEGLSEEVMREIASGMKMNLVEIAFVTIPETGNASFRIRFFTPSRELDMSGHVTIATCFALIEEGRIPLNDGLTKVIFETKVGHVPIAIYFQQDYPAVMPGKNDKNGMVLHLDGERSGTLERIMMCERVHHFHPTNIPVRDIADVLGIDEFEITRTGLPFVRASHNLDWLIIPVQHKETILNMHPDLIKLGILNRQYGIQTNHIFTLDTFDSESITYSRHFGPAMGLWEDPASAIASAGLGIYLLQYGMTSYTSMVMEQGKEISSLARILVEIDKNEGEIDAVWVGGLAVTSITRTIDVQSGEIVSTS